MLAYSDKIEMVSVSLPYIGDDTDTNFQQCATNPIHKVTKSFICNHLNQYQYMILFNDTNHVSDNQK